MSFSPTVFSIMLQNIATRGGHRILPYKLSMSTQFPTYEQIKSDRFLSLWNGGALASVFVPLFSLILAHISAPEGGDNEEGFQWWSWFGNGEEGGENRTPWWFFWGDNDEDDENHTGVILFTYLWEMMLFGLIIYWGNMQRSRKENLTLGSGLFMFTNFTANIAILIACMGIEVEGRAIENGFYSQFAVCSFLTNLFWTIYGAAFLLAGRRKSNDSLSVDTTSSSYQEHPPQQQQQQIWPSY